MTYAQITIRYDDGKFWEVKQDPKVNAEYEELANFPQYDKHANGFKWSMSVKGSKQRKFHARSMMTNSIYAMLDNVKAELQKDPSAIVRCLAPDVTVEFTN